MPTTDAYGLTFSVLSLTRSAIFFAVAISVLLFPLASDRRRRTRLRAAPAEPAISTNCPEHSLLQPPAQVLDSSRPLFEVFALFPEFPQLRVFPHLFDSLARLLAKEIINGEFHARDVFPRFIG
jgi:hypothetical protein